MPEGMRRFARHRNSGNRGVLSGRRDSRIRGAVGIPGRGGIGGLTGGAARRGGGTGIRGGTGEFATAITSRPGDQREGSSYDVEGG